MSPSVCISNLARARTSLVLVLIGVASACGDSTSSSQGPSSDAAATPAPEAGRSPSDAAPSDATVADTAPPDAGADASPGDAATAGEDSAAETSLDAAFDAGVAPTCAMALDPTFGTAGIVALPLPPNPLPGSISFAPDGKIFLGGDTLGHSIVVGRYGATGSLDTTFGTGGFASLPPVAGDAFGSSLAVQPDGKAIVVGIGADATNAYVWQVARLDASGALDTSFGVAGLAPSPTTKPARSSDVALLGDGSFLVGGAVDNGNGDYDFLLAKYDSAGKLDTTFGTQGAVTTSFGASTDLGSHVLVQRDGKILLGGHTAVVDDAGDQYDLAIARYTAAGSLDATFGARRVIRLGAGEFDVAGFAEVSTGAIVVSAIRYYTNDFYLLRLTAAGQFDPIFAGSGIVPTDFYCAGGFPPGLSLLPGDDLLVAGMMPESPDGGGVFDIVLERFYANGDLDTTLGPGGKVTTRVPGLLLEKQALQPDGRLVVGGYGKPQADGGMVVSLARYGCR